MPYIPRHPTSPVHIPPSLYERTPTPGLFTSPFRRIPAGLARDLDLRKIYTEFPLRKIYQPKTVFRFLSFKNIKIVKKWYGSVVWLQASRGSMRLPAILTQKA